MLARRGGEETGVLDLADLHCRRARRRIADRFRTLFRNDDRATYGIAKRFLEGDFEWLERGIVPLDAYRLQVERAEQPEVPPPERVDQPVRV
jgi:hypothetical protein